MNDVCLQLGPLFAHKPIPSLHTAVLLVSILYLTAFLCQHLAESLGQMYLFALVLLSPAVPSFLSTPALSLCEWLLSPASVQEHTVDIPPVSNGPSRGLPPTQLILPPSQQQSLRKSQGSVLYCRQFWALFVKRAISAKRDRLAVVMQLLVPILLVLLALRAGKASSSLVQEPSLLISRCAVLCCAVLCHN